MHISPKDLENKTNKVLQRLNDYLSIYSHQHFDVSSMSVYDFIQLLEKNRFTGTAHKP